MSGSRETSAEAKYAAQYAVATAIRRGVLVRPDTCSKCGATPKRRCGGGMANIQAHHEDYSAPLDVTWLCPKCHTRRHSELGDLKRTKAA